jgi:hypothetical protein
MVTCDGAREREQEGKMGTQVQEDKRVQWCAIKLGVKWRWKHTPQERSVARQRARNGNADRRKDEDIEKRRGKAQNPGEMDLQTRTAGKGKTRAETEMGAQTDGKGAVGSALPTLIPHPQPSPANPDIVASSVLASTFP